MFQGVNLKNRPFKELSDKVIKKIQNVTSGNSIKTPTEFSQTTDTMLYNLHVHLDYHKGDLQDIKSRKDSSSGNGWVTNLADINRNYKIIYDQHLELIDEEKSIHRVEKKAHVRALIFRFLTTLSIGFGVMLVYLVAQYFEVAMPLIRVSA